MVEKEQRWNRSQRHAGNWGEVDYREQDRERQGVEDSEHEPSGNRAGACDCADRQVAATPPRLSGPASVSPLRRPR